MAFDQVPSLCRHKGRGQFYVTLNGREYYLGTVRSVAKVAYDRLIGEWLAGGRQLPGSHGSGGLTISRLLAAYREFAEGYYVKDGKPTTELTHLAAMSRLLRANYGETLAAEFGPLSLIALQNRMVEIGWSRVYANMIRSKLVRMFRWATSRELLPASVFQALSTTSGLKKGRTTARECEPVLPVADAVVEKTIPHLSPVVADMVRLQRLTGCRPAELCDVRPCDVDRSGDVWSYRPRKHKTEHHGRERTIFIGPKAQAILAKYLIDREPTEYCFAPAQADRQRREELHERRKTPESCGNRPGSNRKRKPRKRPGERYDVHAYRRAITYGCVKAFNMPVELRTIPAKLEAKEKEQRLAAAKAWRAEYCWSPNQLRHAAATEIRRRFGLEPTQTVLGHSQANVTQIYAERDQAAAAAVMREVG